MYNTIITAEMIIAPILNVRSVLKSSFDTGIAFGLTPLFGDPNVTIDPNQPIWESISVDASCLGNPGYMEFQGVETKTSKKLFSFKCDDGTNNVGEFLALVAGLAYANAKGLGAIPIYTDSQTAMSWVKKQHCNTSMKGTPNNKPILKMIGHAVKILRTKQFQNPILKWDTRRWGEIQADYGRK